MSGLNKDDIIRMAQESWVFSEAHIPNILEFANLVAAAEREACVKVCEEFASDAAEEQDFHALDACEKCADEIRARGQE